MSRAAFRVPEQAAVEEDVARIVRDLEEKGLLGTEDA